MSAPKTELLLADTKIPCNASVYDPDFMPFTAPAAPSHRPIYGTAGAVSPCAVGFSGVTRAAIIVAVITGGLALDQHVAFWGQTLTNAGVWALFLWWLRQSDARQQICLTACVVYATVGEIFLSLVWGLYDYRLANIPLFVPPGHALLLVLGFLVAERVKDWIVWTVPLVALPFVLVLLVTGVGTLDGLLFALFLACVLFGSARRLYAVMFVLALAMEIYGTWLGNWAWAGDVPWLGLTSINPPLAAGAFYCVLDMLVVTTVSMLQASSARAERLPSPAPVS
jgi:hypothetical protein